MCGENYNLLTEKGTWVHFISWLNTVATSSRPGRSASPLPHRPHKSAFQPTALFLLPVVLDWSAPEPRAVLPPPVVFWKAR
jgi:hypothetical protein